MTVPERGDLVIMDFDPQAGHEQAKRRPALVLSTAAFNTAFGLALVAPVTSKARGHAFEVPLPDGAAVYGVVLTHQLKSLDWRARRTDIVGHAPDMVTASVVDLLKTILDG